MDNIKRELDTVLADIPNLTFRAGSLATEDFGMYVSKVSSFFTDKVKVVSEIFSKNESRLNLVDKKAMSVQLKDNLDMAKDAKTIVSKVKYDEIKNIETPVILGIKVNYIEVVNSMKPIIKLIDSKLISTLDQVDTNISKMISDNDYRKGFKNITTIPKDSDAMLKFVGDIIDPNGTLDRLPIKLVIPNITSLTLLTDTLIELDKAYSYEKVMKVKELVKKLSSKADTLYEVLQDEDLDPISKSSIQKIAIELEESAKLVTNSISVFYVLKQLTGTTKGLIKILNR